MFKSSLIALTALVSSQSFAASLDFANVPKDSLVFCQGQDAINSDQTTTFGLNSIYSPNKAFAGAFNYLHVVYNVADTTQAIQVPTVAQKPAALADATQLKAFLTKYLGQSITKEAIDSISKSPANYPMTAVSASNVVNDDKGAPAQKDITLNMFGFTQKDDKGKTFEYGLSLYLSAPAVPATAANAKPGFGNAELASYAFQTCEYVKLVDMFKTDAAPAK